MLSRSVNQKHLTVKGINDRCQTYANMRVLKLTAHTVQLIYKPANSLLCKDNKQKSDTKKQRALKTRILQS